MHTKVWSENLEKKDHLEDLGTDGRMSNYILKK
jgi:hypothetical protein